MINDLVNAFNTYKHSPARWQDHSDGWSQGIKKANWGYPRSRNRFPPLIEKYELTPDTPPPPKLPSKLTPKERGQKQLAVLSNYEKLTNKPAPNFILSLIDQLKRYGKELSEKQREVVIKMMGPKLIGENLIWFT